VRLAGKVAPIHEAPGLAVLAEEHPMTGHARDFIEIAVVAPGTVLVSLSNGNFMVPARSPLAFTSPWLMTMAANPSLSSTRALLTAAFYAALKQQQEAGGGCDRELTLSGVIFNLVGSYHTTHATQRLLPVAADRFRALGRLSLADYLEKKIREERGHDRLALKDLRALGLPAERLVAAIRPSMIANLLDYFEAVANAADPMGTVGYSYALERNALFIGNDYIQAVQAVCPPGVDATRCLRLHSATGADASHVEEMVEFIATLPAEDRLTVLRSAYETMKIIAAPAPEDRMTDEELESILEEAACSSDSGARDPVDVRVMQRASQLQVS
jgi:hypothetical protein